MAFMHEIKMTLNNYQGTLYKMIELRIISDSGLFIHGALSYVLRIDDGINQASGFYMETSGNQKELIFYFTTDAFTSFSTSSDIIFGYADNPDQNSIASINVTTLTSLPPELSIIPHSDANNTWLSSL